VAAPRGLSVAGTLAAPHPLFRVLGALRRLEIAEIHHILYDII
jgi:hypothetical protein